MIRSATGIVVAMFAVFLATFAQPGSAQSPTKKIGIVVMHGKGGTPGGLVGPLAGSLERKGFLVANLEMPWSRDRGYDVDVATAENEVEAAIAGLRSKGATRVFVAGHSQGGVFTLHFGGNHAVDGIVAIAPGGDVSNRLFRDKLGQTVHEARKLVKQGKGSERTRFYDFEGSKGRFPVQTSAATYLAWFDPDGAMNQKRATKKMNPAVPVLFVAPKNDYPGLLKVKHEMYRALPRNPQTRLYEPDTNHVNAPTDSADEIARWVAEIADKPGVGKP